jgi:predicted TPR repeat methyltransferase
MPAGKRDVDTDRFVARAYGLAGVDQAQDLYREWASSYDAHMVGELGYVAPDLASRRLAAHLDDRAAPILDIGCGTGLTSVYLAELGFAAIDGIDITPEMIDRARARGIYRGLIRADLTRPLPMAEATYGGAVSSGTFTHGHVGPEPLGEIARVLMPGGLLACSIHEEIWEARGFKAAFERLEADGLMATVEIAHDVLFRGQDPVGLYGVFRRL